MSLIDNIDHLARAPGVLAVAVDVEPSASNPTQQARAYRGTEEWRAATLGELKLPGALWWTARQLVGARLAAAVPDPDSWRGNSSETPKSSIRAYDGPLEVSG